MHRKPGTDTIFRRSLPEIGCLSQGLPRWIPYRFVLLPKTLSTPVGQAILPNATYFSAGDHSAQIVGQPILAAAGFQPALRLRRHAPRAKKPPKRRLRARLPAPQQMQNIAHGKSMWH
jgi:hypothetical protein